MPLWWLVHRDGGKPIVFLQPAYALVYARLNALIAGFPAADTEAHMLEPKMARKVPKAMIGRALAPREVGALLKRLGK